MSTVRHLLLALSYLSLAVPSAAQASDDEVFAFEKAELVSDEELGEQRGGFRWDGLEIAFGAELRSYISDALVVQTNISWVNSQLEVQNIAADGLTPLSSSDLKGILGGSGLSSDVGVGSAFLSNDGNTAFIQRADVALQNIIVNSASNVDIRQQLDAKLDIANFVPFQAGIVSDRIGAALGAMIGLPGVGS